MTVKERLTNYIYFKKLSKTEFCRTIGVSPAFISSMRVSIQPDKVERIALNYPDLNTGWLLTGEGDMIKNNQDIVHYNEIDSFSINEKLLNDVENLKEIIASKNEIIAMLKEKVEQLEVNLAGARVKRVAGSS